MEQRETTVKTEIKDGKKIVTTTTVVTTDLTPMNMSELRTALADFGGQVSLPVSDNANPAGSRLRGRPETKTLYSSVLKPDVEPGPYRTTCGSGEGSDIIAPKTKKAKSAFQKEALERHNYYRSLHGVAPLSWCSKCTTKAQKHADYLAQTHTFSHSEDKGWGENLFTSMNSRGPDISANAAVDSWYEEISLMKNYTDPSPSNFYEVGHFTQLIWKGTTHVGMAFAVNGNHVYVVANYLPPGNVVGRFHEHVFPPLE